MVMSDYGMTDLAPLNHVKLEQFINLKHVQYIIYAPGYALITPLALRHGKVFAPLEAFSSASISFSLSRS